MTGRRRALVVATDTYDHAALGQLRSAAADAVALSEVLGDPEVGGFEVDVVRNAASHEVQAHIEDLFADSGPDDLVLLHFSGHGLKSDSGELFIAARNTRPDRLASSSVPADFVQRCMRGSRAHSIVLFLDCCYGGAFGEGVTVRAAGPVNVMDAFPKGRLGGGRGRAVISASSAIEYAFEGTTLTAEHEAPPSVFTSAVVHGLRTGDADRDEDGLVSLDELYDYVFDRVREANPKQTPGRDIEMSGEIYVARSRRRRLKAAPLPDALATALRNPDPTYRRGAVLELRDRLAHRDLSVALGALEALRAVAAGDVRSVSDDALAAIDAALPTVTPASLDLGEVDADASVDVLGTVTLGGVPLARQVSVEADPPLSAEVDGDRVVVTFSPTGLAFAGSITLTGPTGSTTVPVTVSVGAAEASTVSTGEPRRLVPAGSSEALARPRVDALPDDAPTHDTVDADIPAPVETVSTQAPSSPRPAASTSEQAPEQARVPDRRPAASVLGWLAVASALLVVVGGLFVPWGAWDSSANPAAADVLSASFYVVLALASGVALLTQRPMPAVGTALAVPTGVLGLLRLVGAMSLLVEAKPPGPGWWMHQLGVLGMVAVAVVLLSSSSSRRSLARGRVTWRDPAVIVLVVAAVVAAVALVDTAVAVRDSGTIVYQLLWQALWVAAVGILLWAGLGLRPRALARAWLGATALLLLNGLTFTWMVVAGDDRDPRLLPVGTGAAVVVLAASGLVGRRGTEITTDSATAT